MHNSAALSCEFADERQRDDTLATAGPTGHRDHTLGVLGTRVLHCMHNQVDRQLLVSDQPELRATRISAGPTFRSCFDGATGELINKSAACRPGTGASLDQGSQTWLPYWRQ